MLSLLTNPRRRVPSCLIGLLVTIVLGMSPTVYGEDDSIMGKSADGANAQKTAEKAGEPKNSAKEENFLKNSGLEGESAKTAAKALANLKGEQFKKTDLADLANAIKTLNTAGQGKQVKALLDDAAKGKSEALGAFAKITDEASKQKTKKASQFRKTANKFQATQDKLAGKNLVNTLNPDK